MSEQEYKHFLEYIFNEYVRDRLPRVHDHYEFELHHHRRDKYLHILKRPAILTRYIHAYCDDEGDIYRTFTAGALGGIIRNVETGLHRSNRLLEQAGFLDAFDSYLEEIIEGIKPEYFPKYDLEVLREMGSTNPKADLRGIVYAVKRRKEERRRMSREIPIRRQLELAEEELERTRKQLEESVEEKQNNIEVPKKSRRWFKGLGQIAQGAALSIADVGIAVGMLHFPVSPETQTLGALVSTATGVGNMLNGIGELRNE